MRVPIICAAAMFIVAPLYGQENPTPATPELIAKGKAVFEGKAGGALCFSCHAMSGKGISGVGPDLTDGKWLHVDGTVASLETVIRLGVPKPKQSVASMPPMGGAKLDSAQVHAVAVYLRSLNKP